jgi:hypothetical protein
MSSKNILLVAPDNDISTNEIIKWILYRGYTFLRINASYKIEIIEVDMIEERIMFKYKGKKYDMFKEFTSVLFRRGRLGINLTFSIELKAIFKNEMFQDYFKLERNFLDSSPFKVLRP